MYTGIYKIANLTMKISSVFEDVQHLCAAYRTEEPPDILITTAQEDINREKTSTPNGQNFYDGYLETLAVYRKISEEMLRRNTLLFHGSAIAVDGEAYLFTATSGTGKSTHTRLWREMLGDRAIMVNDDKPLLKIQEDRIYVCGTPWNGKHGLGTNVILPLKAICVLERGKENSMEEISVREVLPMLMQQSYHPADKSDYPAYFDLLDQLGKHLRFYRLHCNISREAAELSYRTMHGTTAKEAQEPTA